MKTRNGKAPVPFKKILFATDFSPSADAASAYARRIAQRYSSTIYVVHVISPIIHQFAPPEPVLVSYEQARERAERQMADFIAAGRFEDVPHQVLLRQGEVPDVLCDLVRKYDVDLMVLGSHGRRGVRRFVLGSVAEEIFRLAPCPVLIVGPKVEGAAKGRATPRRILFATDLTPDSLRGLPYALSLARAHRARLALLHVLPFPAGEGDEAIVERRLRNMIPAAAGLPYEPDILVRVGFPPDTILRTAADRRTDLIVLGVRGAGSWARASTHLPGPTAYKVVTEARCPVLTVGAGRLVASRGPKRKTSRALRLAS